MHTVLAVTFATETRAESKGFKFPENIHSLLGLEKDGDVALVVRKTSGDLVFCGVAKLTSGNELTAANVCRDLAHGEEIIVVASRPPEGE